MPASDLKTLVPCFGTFQCGRLNVPLDYSRTDGPNAIIPVAILPATDKANYKGAFFLLRSGECRLNSLSRLHFNEPRALFIDLGVNDC